MTLVPRSEWLHEVWLHSPSMDRIVECSKLWMGPTSIFTIPDLNDRRSLKQAFINALDPGTYLLLGATEVVC